MPDNSVDSIVTDPPYELTADKKGGTGLASLNVASPAGRARIGTGGFMGKSWDATGIAHNVDFWRECLRVLKPGGHLLAAGGTRTYHRLACAIEDAGFEIRDSISWIYSTGFPKSLDVSKAIDKAAGAEREVLSSGKAVKRMIPGADQNSTGSWIKDNGREFIPSVTAPATLDAQKWQGFGTALKPAVEPFVLARKSIVGTVAANVLAYGTGALNIDASRIESMDSQLAEKYASVRNAGPRNNAIYGGDSRDRSEGNVEPHRGGRWPANLIHDNSDEVVAGFPTTAPSRQGTPCSGSSGNGWGMTATGAEFDDEGSAARYFKSVAFEDDDVQSFFYTSQQGEDTSWPDPSNQNDPASTAETTSYQSSPAAASALAPVLNEALPEGLLLLDLSMELSTNVTENEYEMIVENATQLILSTVSRCWPESQPLRHFPSDSLVSIVATQEPTGTTTITANLSTSDGYAVRVTFNTMPESLGFGGEGLRAS